MRFNPKANIGKGRVRDAGGGGGLGGGLGGSGMRIPMPSGKAGGGIGTIIVVVLLFVLVQCMGGNLLGGSSPGNQSGPNSDGNRYDECQTGEDANNNADCARKAVAVSLEDYWSNTLPDQAGVQFTPADINTFSGSTNTGCGGANSQVGPFYCPVDKQIYLDTTFFKDILEGQLGGHGGDFVEPYVLAHEYGHHIQNLLGTMNKVKTQQGPRSDAVRLELQADCYAGMWVKAATNTQDDSGVAIFESIDEADITEAMNAASDVGDDSIQKKTQGQVTEETWTHGSSASRQKWFKIGQAQGSLQACDTWAVDTP